MSATQIAQPHHGPVAPVIPLNADWRFGGAIAEPLPVDWPDHEMAAAAAEPGLDDSGFELVHLPHTVVPLSWTGWDHRAWEKVWTYRRHVELPELDPGSRVFLDFDAVNVTATVTVNGVRIGRHWGGYLPFSFEVTGAFHSGDNVMAVLVDARFNLNVPPNLPDPAHSEEVDYWQPGGIHGTVTLRIEPPSFVGDVAATPRDVLDAAARRVDVVATVDTARDLSGATLEAHLETLGGTVVASAPSTRVDLPAGLSEVATTIRGLGDVELWDVEAPRLYRIVTRLVRDGLTLAEHRTRIGFREARFEVDGFFLNGRRLYLFGANRHQHFPYAGYAMPERVQRRDAALLRQELNCVMVRCSHYPQFSGFLDACDELGLLVWEESAGWQYVGDDTWRSRAEQDIAAMVTRDRNRPSVIIWAPRLNETPDHPDWYVRTEAMVKAIDDTRATSGTTHGPYHRTPFFQHDVFAYDDYSIDVLPDGDHRPTLRPPREDFPYLIAETVTSWSSPARLYRRADPAEVQQHQAMDYAHVHERARADERFAGVLAWSAIDYQAGHVVNWRGMKTSGLLDTFRVPKPGAAMYRSQVDRSVRPVLEPAFTWDPPVERQLLPGADNRTTATCWGPGERAVIFSNCDRVEVTVAGKHRATVTPDSAAFPHLVTPPAIVDLSMTGRDGADLLLEGYIGDEIVITRQFSGSHEGDHLVAAPDDPEIVADGVDATRVELAVVDCFGEARGHSEARVMIDLSGPGVLIGEPVFDFSETGAVGAVWVRSRGAGDEGLITVRAGHPRFGNVSANIRAAR
jgi:beta-galactosidase